LRSLPYYTPFFPRCSSIDVSPSCCHWFKPLERAFLTFTQESRKSLEIASQMTDQRLGVSDKDVKWVEKILHIRTSDISLRIKSNLLNPHLKRELISKIFKKAEVLCLSLDCAVQASVLVLCTQYSESEQKSASLRDEIVSNVLLQCTAFSQPQGNLEEARLSGNCSR
jgi:hypothetical protein